MWLLLKSKILSNISWIALVCLLLVMLTLKQCQLEKAKRKASDLKSLYRAEVNRSEQFKKNGKNYTRVEAATIDAKNIKLLENDEIKALKKEIGNLKRRLISYSKVSTSTEGSFTTRLKDTLILEHISAKNMKTGILNSIPKGKLIVAKHFSCVDQYLNFEGTISGDSVIAKYCLRSPFQFYYYYKRPGRGVFKIFRKKIAFAEIKFENPNTRADNLYSILLNREKRGVRKFIGI